MSSLLQRTNKYQMKTDQQLNFLRDRIKSFFNATQGLRDILLTEHNAWVHAAVTVAVLALAWWLKLKPVEFVLILIFICLVWIAEAFNTVLELVIDIVAPEYSQAARRAKDMAAAAVLFASAGAFVAGLIILVPPLIIRLGLI